MSTTTSHQNTTTIMFYPLPLLLTKIVRNTSLPSAFHTHILGEYMLSYILENVQNCRCQAFLNQISEVGGDFLSREVVIKTIVSKMRVEFYKFY